MQPQLMGAADVSEVQCLTNDRTEPPKDRVSQECRVSALESEPSNGAISKAPTPADVTLKESEDRADAQIDDSTAVPTETRATTEAAGSMALDLFSGLVQGVGKGLPSAPVSWFGRGDDNTETWFFTGLSNGAQGLTLGLANGAQGLGVNLNNIQAHAPDMGIFNRPTTQTSKQTSTEPSLTLVPPPPPPPQLQISPQCGSADTSGVNADLNHPRRQSAQQGGNAQTHIAPRPQFPPALEAPSQAKRGSRNKPPTTADGHGHLQQKGEEPRRIEPPGPGEGEGGPAQPTPQDARSSGTPGRPRRGVDVDLKAGRLEGLV